MVPRTRATCSTHLLLGVLFTAPVCGQDRDPRVVRIEDRLSEVLAEGRREHGFPGASVAFSLPDGATGVATTGFADQAEQEPLTPDSWFLSGSVGKTYVAAVALQRVATGDLELDAPVARYLGDETWFPRLPGGEAITLRMLLGHRSGVPEHVWMPEFHAAIEADPYRTWRPEELVAFVLDAEPRFPPGEGWAYADTNYILVGMVLERVTGRSWYELLREDLLESLGLARTAPSDRPDLPGLVNGFTSGTGFHEGPTHEGGRYFANPQFEWCGGGVASTTRDLVRWCRHLFAGEVVPAALREAQLSGGPQNRRIGGRYGLGVVITKTRHGTAYGHSGIMPGYLSQMAYYPAHDVAVAIQFNTDVARQLGRGLGAWLDEVTAVVLAPGRTAREAPVTVSGPGGG